MKRVFGLMAILAVGLILDVGVALADSTSYTINNPNAALAPYAGPYATVDVNRTDATHATITFTSLTTSGVTFLMGGNGAADVNVNANSWTVSSLSGTALAGFTNGVLSDDGSNNISTFGTFNQTIDNFDGYTHSHNMISFILTNTSGAWANAASVLIANASGNTVAVHGFACTAPCSPTAGALVTGYAANGGGSVPEPTSLMLLGAGLAGLGIWRRKLA